MRIRTTILAGLIATAVGGCGADASPSDGSADPGTDGPPDALEDAPADAPADLFADAAARCRDGVRNGDESGVDCGGSCPNPDCCANGYADPHLGETGTDCGGSCGSCVRNCRNGERDGDENGVDCGGSCAGTDCCTNGYVDVGLGESGVDCGGSCGACGSAVTYFVAADGDDLADGTSPVTAWRTVARVNEAVLRPGDAVLFRRGDTWRETLVIASSGTPEAYLTFGPWGDAEGKPRILGSERATDFEPVAGSPHRWRSGTPLVRPDVGRAAGIFFGRDGVTHWGRVQATDQVPTCDRGMTQEFDWCWDDGLVVWSPEDPDLRYDFVEVPQRRSAVQMPGHDPQQYVALDGLELMFATMYGYDDGWPMAYQVRGLQIRNCRVGYIGIQGGAAAMGLQIWHSDVVVRNNEIHDCGRRGVSYNVYLDNGRETDGVCDSPGLVFENVLLEGNTLHHGFHTTGFDISSQPDRIETCHDTFRNFTLRNNYIWDDPDADPQAEPNDFTSMGIYLWGEGARFTGFRIFNNVLAHTKQKALVLYGVHDTQVFHNTFYGMNERAGVLGTGSAYRGLITVGGAVDGLHIEGNLLYGNVGRDRFHLRCISFADEAAAAGGVVLDRNLYFQQDPTQALVSTPSDSWDMAEWSAYRTATGWDTHSPDPADPRLSLPVAADFAPLPGSPAIDAGDPAEPFGRTTDFHGNPLLGPPDLGAVEHRPE